MCCLFTLHITTTPVNNDWFSCLFLRKREKDSSLNENIPLFNWISRLDDRKGLSMGIREWEQPPQNTARKRERDSTLMCKLAWLVRFDKTVKMYCESIWTMRQPTQHQSVPKLNRHLSQHSTRTPFLTSLFNKYVWLIRFFQLLSALKMFASISQNSLGTPTQSMQKMWFTNIPSGPDHKVSSPVYANTHTIALWSHFSQLTQNKSDFLLCYSCPTLFGMLSGSLFKFPWQS